MTAPAGTGYPVSVDLDAPLEVANWRPLVHWLLSIPHYVVYYVLTLVQGVIWLISWFAILFTGQFPRGLFDFQVMIFRYGWRYFTYFSWLREPYPPFDLQLVSDDPGNDPARLTVAYPERLSRGLIFVKWLLAIPHFFVLFVLFLGGFFAAIGGFFAVLFTGRWPEGLRDFLVGISRWYFRVTAYVYLLTDEYPPFSLE